MNQPETYALFSTDDALPAWAKIGLRLASPAVYALDKLLPEHEVFATLASLALTHSREKGVAVETFRSRMIAMADAYEVRTPALDRAA